jgi:hypothetical protein
MRVVNRILEILKKWDQATKDNRVSAILELRQALVEAESTFSD